MRDERSGRVGDPYRLGRRLETDSSGDTFETVHPLVPGPCTLKILRAELTERPEAVEAFEADLRALARLRHPNILPVLDVGAAAEGTVIVTERLEGRTLAERLAEQGLVPLTQVPPIVRGAAAALQAAHNLGMVHGELNPRTLFLARADGYEQGVVKLRDFGLVRLRPADAAASLPLEAIRYLAPEQAAGRGDAVDARTDQFALALIAYRMLRGADLFAGDSAVSVLYEIVHGNPPIELVGVGGPEVEAVIRRALSKDRDARYEDVVAFARALEAATEHELGLSTGAMRLTPPPVRISAPAPPPAPAAAPAVDPDPFLTHPFFTDDPGPRRRRRVIVRRRPPSAAGRLFLLLLLVAAASLGGALAVGWRPPLAWRQSLLWNQLHLPGAADPSTPPTR